MSKKTDALKALQAASLDRPKTAPKQATASKQATVPEAPTIKKSIALQSKDVEKLDQLEAVLRDQGHRVSFSRLIQIAIKTASTDPAILSKALDECKAADGRASGTTVTR